MGDTYCICSKKTLEEALKGYKKACRLNFCLGTVVGVCALFVYIYTKYNKEMSAMENEADKGE